jgi:energy-converting hydrogenase Eha subunit A
MDYWIKFTLVFFAVAGADVCWTFYFIKVGERKIWSSAMWSSMIMALGAFSIESYVEDQSLIIATILGAFAGTAGSVFYKKRQEK